MGLGGSPDPSCKAGRLNLEPGDTVLLATDGLTEATDKDDRMFGMDRLLSVLKSDGFQAPGDLVRELVKDVKEFSAGTFQRDDQMILAFKVK